MTTFTIPAAATVLFINGKAYGAVSSFGWTSNTPHKEVNGIDDLSSQELIPTTAKVTGSVGLYRITGSGGLEGIGVTTQFDKMSSEKYFVLQLIDTRTDQIIFQARQCKVESQSWTSAARSLVTGTMTFQGLTWDNEVSQQA